MTHQAVLWAKKALNLPNNRKVAGSARHWSDYSGHLGRGGRLIPKNNLRHHSTGSPWWNDGASEVGRI